MKWAGSLTWGEIAGLNAEVYMPQGIAPDGGVVTDNSNTSKRPDSGTGAPQASQLSQAPQPMDTGEVRSDL